MKRSVKILSTLAVAGLLAGIASPAFAEHHEKKDGDHAKVDAKESCDHKDAKESCDHKDDKESCKGEHKDSCKGEHKEGAAHDDHAKK